MSDVMEETKKMAPFLLLPVDANMQLIDQSAFEFASPQSMVIISSPLMGKTLSMVNVEKFMILDLYKETTYFPFCRNKVCIYEEPEDEVFVCLPDGTVMTKKFYDTVMELSRANNMPLFRKLKKTLNKNIPIEQKQKIFDAQKKLLNKMPFPVTVVDTLTQLQAMNFRACLYLYNSGVEPEYRKQNVRRIDKYNGTKLTRPNFFGILDFVEKHASPFIIYNAHVREKKSVYEKDAEDLSTIDINLEGLVSSTYTNRMGAVGIFNRTEEGCFLDFVKRVESDLGGRPMHLWNRVLKVADFTTEPKLLPKRYWGEVYTDLTFNN
jgi:hypothetical protein